MGQKEIQLVLLVVLLIILLLVIIVFVLFSVFMRRKNTIIRDKIEAAKRFEREIAEAQIEIREETLRNISWELHDNIGQLLTLAKIRAQNVNDDNDEIKEVAETIGNGLNELRALSRSINPESIKNLTLDKLLKQEIDRFNRLDFLKAEFKVWGAVKPIDKKAGVVIFRILQEFFANTLKHSRASTLKLTMNYSKSLLQITVKDDGIGFIKSRNNSDGIGLQNMKKRASLIKADLQIDSTPGQGTNLDLKYKYLLE